MFSVEVATGVKRAFMGTSASAAFFPSQNASKSSGGGRLGLISNGSIPAPPKALTFLPSGVMNWASHRRNPGLSNVPVTRAESADKGRVPFAISSSPSLVST
ncbi:MAG: hypothetical protein BWX80_02829 [Candidatus Hydrogenedentes bacterium ADurb.Bin101]|nr:MAG: hypothetical protein BWX80_02829 [Candidatus Hydrogenedentes bacterium ADurb.Bin101]